jgi:hypothetical protein
MVYRVGNGESVKIEEAKKKFVDSKLEDLQLICTFIFGLSTFYGVVSCYPFGGSF